MEEGKVKMYVCGPTVYDYIHIGNARPYVVFDTVRRYLEYKGYEVTYVQNFTDVDDKIINRANKEGKTMAEISNKYIEEAFRDADGLNVKRATVHPRVTEEMDGIIAMVQTLIDKGFAYEDHGTVYYDTKKFPEYGKLSRKNLDELIAGASERVTIDDAKKNPTDFVLWKPKKEGEPSWTSPWGEGRPGWHIECSVMSKHHLGDTFDIHAGGEDLIFPHHENEIAQSECCTGKEYAHYWMHNGFLNIDNRKMSKSLGNMYTLEDLEKLGHKPEAVRYVLAGGYYRRPLNFTLSSLEDARGALNRMAKFDAQLRTAAGMDNIPSYDEFRVSRPELGLFQPAWDSLNDDLNTPEALGHVFTAMRKAEVPSLTPEEALHMRHAFHFILNAFGIILPKEEKEEAPEEVRTLAEQRWQAKQSRDWAEADRLRAAVTALGWTIKDRKDDYDIVKS